MTDRLGNAFVIMFVAATTAAFLYMVRGFVMVLLLAAIFAGLSRPLYVRLLRMCRGRQALASALSLLVLVLVVALPLLALLGMVASEALHVADRVRTRVPELSAEASSVLVRWQDLPIYGKIEPYFDQAIAKAGEALAAAGKFFLSHAQDATLGTVSFFVSFFMMLYAMFYFFMDGPALVGAIRRHLPLSAKDADRVFGRFLSVTRATLKGVLLIATIQGAVNGLAFWLVGIQGSVFWGVMMILLSIIPLVGGAIVWVPVVGYLLLTGDVGRALFLLFVCGLVSGSLDNLLRPRLVGRDTQMHSLLILLSTLGGLDLFGLAGFIVGPILAAVFLTAWEIFGATFGTRSDQTADPEAAAPAAPSGG